ncbi:MAG: D-glucuronyl C5-epimerase family protein, partial [Candidatus Thorarchaeota archaeon]
SYKLFGNESLIDICDKVVRAFEIPILDGGNLYILDDDTSWYPEYIVPGDIDPDYEPALILNGFLICLYNLYLANEILNSTRLETVFNKGVESAAANLHKYDSPYNWSLYHLDTPMKLAPNNYHRIHINFSGFLYEFTNITVFDTYSTLWASYSGKPLFTWEELTSPEFIYYGLVMVSLIIGPVIAIDIAQIFIRRRLKTSESKE